MQKDEGVKIITFCLAGNMLLMLLKGVVGLLSGSQALTADAVNSAGDVMSSLAVLLGLRYAGRPRDEDHHYGHGKMEALVSLFVGIFILAGTGFLAADVAGAIIRGEPAVPSAAALAAAVISVGVKVVMYRVTIRAGKRLNSIAIMTNAKDHLNDIMATSGAALAIVLVMIGRSADIMLLQVYAEPVLAGVMCLFIVRTAVEIIRTSSKMLLDAAPDRRIVDEMNRIIAEVDGVVAYDWVKCRKMGRGMLVDTAVQVDGCITVGAGHDIGDNVKYALMAHFPEVIDVVVHINPGKCAQAVRE